LYWLATYTYEYFQSVYFFVFAFDVAKQTFPIDNKEQTEVEVNVLTLGFAYGSSIVLIVPWLEYLF
jgi:hypothetical protein